MGGDADDVGVHHGGTSAVDCRYRNAELQIELACQSLTVSGSRAVNANFLEWAYRGHGHRLGTRLPPRSDQGVDACIRRRQVLRAQRVGAGDTQSLDDTVRHDRERFAVAGAEQQDEATELAAGRGWLLVLAQPMRAVLPPDNIGVQPDCCNLEPWQQPVHRLEYVPTIIVHWAIDVAARSVARLTAPHLAVGLLQLCEAVLHCEKLSDLRIVQ